MSHRIRPVNSTQGVSTLSREFRRLIDDIGEQAYTFQQMHGPLMQLIMEDRPIFDGQSSVRSFPAKITEVFPDGNGFNAEYSATAVHDTSKMVVQVVPQGRSHDINEIDVRPVDIDHPCFLSDHGDEVLVLWVFDEFPSYEPCA